MSVGAYPDVQRIDGPGEEGQEMESPHAEGVGEVAVIPQRTHGPQFPA